MHFNLLIGCYIFSVLPPFVSNSITHYSKQSWFASAIDRLLAKYCKLTSFFLNFVYKNSLPICVLSLFLKLYSLYYRTPYIFSHIQLNHFREIILLSILMFCLPFTNINYFIFTHQNCVRLFDFVCYFYLPVCARNKVCICDCLCLLLCLLIAVIIVMLFCCLFSSFPSCYCCYRLSLF